MSNTYAEKLELVYQCYSKVLDLDVAFTLVPLSDKERKQLEADPELQALVQVCDARLKEDLITRLRAVAEYGTNEGVVLSAIERLGKMFYSRRFKNDAIDVNVLTYKVIPRKKEQA